MGHAGGLNLYAYSGNAPAQTTDAFGLMPCDPPSSCIAITAGLGFDRVFGSGGGISVAGVLSVRALDLGVRVSTRALAGVESSMGPEAGLIIGDTSGTSRLVGGDVVFFAGDLAVDESGGLNFNWRIDVSPENVAAPVGLVGGTETSFLLTLRSVAGRLAKRAVEFRDHVVEKAMEGR